MSRFLLPLFFFCALALPAAAPAATLIDKVVAIVGDEVITLNELQVEMAGPQKDLEQKFRGEELARESAKLKRNILNDLIDKHLQLQEARLLGIEASPEEVDAAIDDVMGKNKMDEEQFAAALRGEGYTLEDYKKNIADQLVMLRLLSHAVKSKVAINKEEVSAYYDENLSDFTQPETVTLAYIFFPAVMGDIDVARQNASKARQEVVSGTPFEDMAVRCTGKPDAAKTCVLGNFSRGQLSPDVEEKIFSMEAGGLSEPLKVKDGYQLIKVMEKNPAQTKPLDEVRGEIVEKLSMKKSEGIFAKWIQELRDRTYVEIRE